MSEQRSEQKFHDSVWRLANDFARVEQGMAEGRDLAYAILNEVEPGTQRWMAERWVERYGRDPLRVGTAARLPARGERNG